MKTVWLSACYPGKFTVGSDGVWTWGYDGGNDKGKSFPFRAPKKKSFVELYNKLVEILQIDSNQYEILLHCCNPKTTKDPPFEIRNDESVVWLMSAKEPPTIYVTLKLKDIVGGSNSTVKSVHNGERNISYEAEYISNVNVEENYTSQHDVDEIFVNQNSRVAENVRVVEVGKGAGLDECRPLLASLDDSCLIPTSTHIDISLEPKNIIVDNVHGLSDGMYEVEPTAEVIEVEMRCDGVDVIPCLNSSQHVTSLRIPSEEPENIIVGGVHSLGNGQNDVEPPTRATEVDIIGDGVDVISSLNASHLVPSSRIPNHEDFHINKCFPTKKDLKRRLQIVAVLYHFEYITPKSNKKDLEVVCAKEGCPWFLKAKRVGSSKVFIVREYGSNHSCSFCIQKTVHRQLTYKMVAEMICYKFEDPKCEYRPREIIADFEREYGYKISIHTAFNARKHAIELIRGNAIDGYARIPKFFHSLKAANPGTKVSLVTTKVLYPNTTAPVNAFKYCFMALGQSIHGFTSSIRPVICVDGTFLSGAFRGVLLVAMCMDGNRQLYPLAFAVVDSENNRSWTYFFNKLKSITGDSHNLVILSDKHRSIKNGFEKVYKNARHGFCTFHIKKNLQSKFPKCDLDFLWEKTYKAYTVEEFNLFFDLLCSKHNGIRSYLSSQNFRYWSRAHFEGHRYDMMTTNIAESMNSKLVAPRGFPIVALLKEIRAILQKWYAERYLEAQSCQSKLTPVYEKKMAKRYNQLREENPKSKVICPNYKWEVCVGQSSFIVDLDAHTCTCRRFDLKKFPCVHALCASRQPETGKDIYTLCSHYFFTTYWREAYSKFIYPAEERLEYPNYVLSKDVMPPKMKKPCGRPARKRKRHAREKMKKKSKELLAKLLGQPAEQPQEMSKEPIEDMRNKAKQCEETEEQPIKKSRKKAKQCEEQEEQPIKKRKKKAKHCGELEEQLGEKGRKKAKQCRESEEQPGEPVNKHKKFASLSSLMTSR